MPHGVLDTPTSNQTNSGSNCLFFCFCFVIFCLLFSVLFIPVRLHADISVRLASADGLPKPDVNASTFSPVFNFTLTFSKKDHLMGEFCNVNGAVTVMYNGFSIANGLTPHFCVKAGKEEEASFQAWGREVELPPPVHELLVREHGNGLSMGVVALKLVVQESSDYYRWLYHCNMSSTELCKYMSSTMYPFAFEREGIRFKL